MDVPIDIQLQVQIEMHRRELETQQRYGRHLSLVFCRSYDHSRGYGEAMNRCDPPLVWLSVDARSMEPLLWLGRDVAVLQRVDQMDPHTGELVHREWNVRLTPDDAEEGAVDDWLRDDLSHLVTDEGLSARAPELVAFWQRHMRRETDRLLP